MEPINAVIFSGAFRQPVSLSSPEQWDRNGSRGRGTISSRGSFNLEDNDLGPLEEEFAFRMGKVFYGAVKWRVTLASVPLTHPDEDVLHPPLELYTIVPTLHKALSRCTKHSTV